MWYDYATGNRFHTLGANVVNKGVHIPEFESYTVTRANNRDLRFEGEIIAETRPLLGLSGEIRGVESEEYRIWRTKGGKFVAAKYLIHEDDDAMVCESEPEIMDYLGYSEVAKEVYRQAGFDTAEDIE